MISHDEAQELHRIIGGLAEQANSHIIMDQGDVIPDLDRALELAAVLVADTMEGGRDSDPSPVSHAPCIQGTIDIDGRLSEFLIPLLNDSVSYSQWGAGNPTLWERTDLVEALADGARDWAEENLCKTCKESMLDDGAGYDGECGDCADRSGCVADCSPDDDELDGPCTECGTDWSTWNGEDHDTFRREQREEREQANG